MEVPDSAIHDDSTTITDSKKSELGAAPRNPTVDEVRAKRLAMFANQQKTSVSSPLPIATSSNAKSPTFPSSAPHHISIMGTASKSPLPAITIAKSPPKRLRPASTGITPFVSTPYDHLFHRQHAVLIERVLGIALLPSNTFESPRSAFSTSFVQDADIADLLKDLDIGAKRDPHDLADHLMFWKLQHKTSSGSDSISYLNTVFSRVQAELHLSVKGSHEFQFLVHLQELSISYSRTSLQLGIFVNDSAPPLNQLLSLLKSGDSELFLSKIFEGICAFDAKDEFAVVVPELLALISKEARSCTVIDHTLPLVRALRFLVRTPAICAHLIADASFVPNVTTGRDFQDRSILGPLLSASALPGDTPFNGSSYFSGPTSDDGANIVRLALERLQGDLYIIVDTALRNDKPKTVTFLALALRQNGLRTQTRANRAVLCSDGFMLNLSAVLLKICQKFTDVSVRSFDKLQTQYLWSAACVIETSQESSIAASPEMLSDIRKSATAVQPNFITQSFFMAIHSLHLGLLPAIEKYSNEFYNEFVSLHQAAIRADASHIDPFAAQLKQRHEIALSFQKAFNAQLMNPAMLIASMRFFSFVADWMLHLLSSDATTESTHSAKLQTFHALPSYFVEDIADLLIFVSRFAPDVLNSNTALCGSASFIDLFVTLIGSRSHVTNPYIRGKLVKVLALYSPEHNNGQCGQFFDNVRSRQISVGPLALALMQFYVDVQDSDFYSRLNMRFDAQVVLKEVWRAHAGRDAIIHAAETPTFIRFGLLVISDITFLLDEARGFMKKIHELRHGQTDQQLDPSETRDALARSEDQLRAVTRLGLETLSLLSCTTVDIVSPFLKEELVQRLASMLNYNFDMLVGDKSSTIKLEHPEQYGFNSSLLLQLFSDVYVNMLNLRADSGCYSEEFVAAIANDGRSYSRDVMNRAIYVLKSLNYPEIKIDALTQLMDLVERAHDNSKDEDDELGDIPEDFLDPIMATLMRNPVILPSSHKIVDRSTIVQHLLGDENDPFNRAKLTVDQLIPAVELKSKIDAWIAAKKQERK